MKAIGLLSLTCAAALTVACSGETTTDSSVVDREESAVGTSGGAADDGGVSGSNDQEFVREMLAAGAAEIQLGQLASQRGTSAEVKQFGDRMVQDHTKAGEQLKQIASRQGITTAAAADDDHRELMERLSGAKGAEFDRAYMEAMVDSHEDVLDKIESHAGGSNRSAAGASTQEHGGAATDHSPTAGTRNAPGTTAQSPAAAADQASRQQTSAPAGQAGGDATAMSVREWAAQQMPVVRQHLERARAIHEKLDNRNSTASR